MMPPSRTTGSPAICRQGIPASVPPRPRRFRPSNRSLPGEMPLPNQRSRASQVQMQSTGSNRLRAIPLAMILAGGIRIRIRPVSIPPVSIPRVSIRMVGI